MVRLDPDKRILTGPLGCVQLSLRHFRFMRAFIKAGFNQPVETASLCRLGWPEWSPSYLPGSLSTEVHRLNQILDSVGGARIVTLYGSRKTLRAICTGSAFARAA